MRWTAKAYGTMKCRRFRRSRCRCAQLPHRFATYETHPPLYFIQLRVWRAFHLRSLVKLRANSALWGSIGLLLAYLVGRTYGGEALGLLTMTLLALSPYHLAYSQEIRPYAMAVTISLAALLSLERRSWILLGFFWTAQLYTHYWGAFVVGAQALYGFWSFPSMRDRKALACALAAAGALFCLWLPMLVTQMKVSDQLSFWVPAFSVQNLVKVFLPYSGLIFNMASMVFYVHAKVWVLALFGFLFVFAFVIGLRRGPRAAVIWFTVGLLLPWILSYWKAGIFVWYRYPIHMLPAFILVAAAGFLAMRPVGLRVLLILLCLASQGWADWTYFTHWQKANPKAVVAYVHHLRDARTIVIRPAYFADLYNFYDGGATSTLDENALDSADKRAALKGYHILLLAFDVPSDPIADALLREFKVASATYFPGASHLGITVYELR